MAKSLLGEKRFIGFRVRFDRLLGSFWWTPLYMIILSVIFAYSLFWLETNGFMDWFIPSNPVNPNTARPNLITVMATLISLFGVIMSVALIPFSLAVGQYGHTVVAIYMKDKGIQNVVGWFGAAIFYCATVLFITPAELSSENIPDMLFTITWIFFIGSLIVVIYFFSHVANLLSAMTVASLISRQTMEEIDRQRPWDRVIQFEPEEQKKFRDKEKSIRLDGIQVRSTRSGYVTGVDYSKLVRRAQLAKVTFLILKSPGDYTAVGEPLVKYIHDKSMFRSRMRFIRDKSAATKPEKVRSEKWLLKQREKFAKRERDQARLRKLHEAHVSRWVNKAYSHGMQRSLLQDIDYGLQELVVMAMTALSPAINAPLTAEICIDRLGLVLGEVAARPTPSRYKLSKKRALRVISDPDTFERLMNTGFNQIRQYGHNQFEIMVRQLNAVEAIAYRANSEEELMFLQYHADLVRNEAFQFLPTEWGKKQVQDAYLAAVKVIVSKRGT